LTTALLGFAAKPFSVTATLKDVATHTVSAEGDRHLPPMSDRAAPWHSIHQESIATTS